MNSREVFGVATQSSKQLSVETILLRHLVYGIDGILVLYTLFCPEARWYPESQLHGGGG